MQGTTGGNPDGFLSAQLFSAGEDHTRDADRNSDQHDLRGHTHLGRRRTGGVWKHRRDRQRLLGCHPPRCNRHHHKPRTQDGRHGRGERLRVLRQGSAAPGHLRGQSRDHGLQDQCAARSAGQRRHADPRRLRPGARSDYRAGRGHRRIADVEDRPRGCLDELRLEADYRLAGSGSELHQVHPADTRHAAVDVAARGERKPAGLNPDDGQRAALQRDGLPARWDGESGPHPGNHRDQPDAGVDRRHEDHLAELRRGVRPGDRGRGLRADQVGQEPVVRKRLRVLPGRSVPVAESVHAVPARSGDRQTPAEDGEEPVRRLARRQDRPEPRVLLRRLPGHAQHRRRAPAISAPMA
jgi:hypothetical protein